MADPENKIALAGLLHDIGKFAQRAGERSGHPWDDAARREFGTLHALLTAGFIDQYLPPAWKDEIRLLLATPRRTKAPVEQSLALAAYLAAGERETPCGDTLEAQPRQLLSIFCSLTADEARAPQELYLPLAELALDEATLFPGPAWEEERVQQAYAGLWQDFCQAAARLRDAHTGGENFPAYLESLLLLLQRSTWCLPDAFYKTRPDAGLYDHARMTAALASILCSAPPEVFGKEYGGELALLVGGDLSGVQEFLYTISAQGAASALRGRSFYLQLLGEALARYILRQLDLPITNLIYCGGGNFYLLARPGDADKLTRIQQQISRVLLRHHHGSLYLALASTALHGEDFLDDRISGAWENLGFSLQYAKQHRFVELGSRLAVVFAPQGRGGSAEQQCQVCGAEHPHIIIDLPHDAVEMSRRDVSTDEGVRKCPACLSYEELGDSLSRAEYLVFESIDPAPLPALTGEMNAGRWEDVFACLGMKASLSPEGGRGGWSSALTSDPADASTPVDRPMQAHTAVGRRLLVNVTPLLSAAEQAEFQERNFAGLPDPGSVKPFDIMEAQAQGIHRLGVLRMDVDNLGQLFTRGLGKSASLARVAALSFAVSLYFEGWVEALANRMNQSSGQRLYSIYSGGDDLFFTGSWDAVVELARQIRFDFTRFTASHPGLHASAGIVLADGKYPLAQAAQNAGCAEAQAKRLKWTAEDGRIHRKDAVSFLGQVLPWEKFGLEGAQACDLWEKAGRPSPAPFPASAHALMHLLVGLAEQQSSAIPLVRRLIALHARYRETLEARRSDGADQNRSHQDQVLWGRWMWLGHYNLQRLADQTHSTEIARLNEQLRRDRFRSIEWIGLAARWAELRLRRG